MSGAMTPRERLLTAIKHKEPDMVPVSPRVGGVLRSYYGCTCWMHQLRLAKEFNFDPIIRLGLGPPYYGQIRAMTWCTHSWMFKTRFWPDLLVPYVEDVSVEMKIERFPKYLIR